MPISVAALYSESASTLLLERGRSVADGFVGIDDHLPIRAEESYLEAQRECPQCILRLDIRSPALITFVSSFERQR